MQGWPIGWYLSNPASFYITFIFGLSFLLILPAIIFLRRLAQSNFSFKTWILTKLHLATGDRTRKPRTVWSNPIAQLCEARTKASAARASMLRYGFMAAGVIGALFLVIRFSTTEEPAQYISRDSYDANTGILTVFNKTSAIKSRRRWKHAGDRPRKQPPIAGTLDDLRGRYAISLTVNSRNVLTSAMLSPIARKIKEEDVRNYLLGAVVLEFAVILLIVTNAAASTVTREKEDGSLDLLLTTPITSRYYIWGKLSGLVGFVVPLVAVPVVSVLMFIFYDIFRMSGANGSERWIAYPESVLIMPAMLIIVVAFAAILGMQMSLRCRTTVLAVMSSVGIVVGNLRGDGLLLAASPWTCTNIGGIPAPSPAVSARFTVLTMLINPYQFAERIFDESDALSNRITIFFSSFAAVGAYAAIVWAMYKSMVKNFDMTIRRQQR